MWVFAVRSRSISTQRGGCCPPSPFSSFSFSAHGSSEPSFRIARSAHFRPVAAAARSRTLPVPRWRGAGHARGQQCPWPSSRRPVRGGALCGDRATWTGEVVVGDRDDER